MLDENNYIKVINGFSKTHWKPLLDLIPEIEKETSFCEIIIRFIQIIDELPIVIVFNWMEWKEGWEMIKNKNFDFDTIDIPTKCKIITGIVRSDRFNGGALELAFESGLIYNILKSIEKQLN